MEYKEDGLMVKMLDEYMKEMYKGLLLESLSPSIFLKNLMPPKPLPKLEKFKKKLENLKWRLKYGLGILFGRITRSDLSEEYGDY